VKQKRFWAAARYIPEQLAGRRGTKKKIMGGCCWFRGIFKPWTQFGTDGEVGAGTDPGELAPGRNILRSRGGKEIFQKTFVRWGRFRAAERKRGFFEIRITWWQVAVLFLL